MTITRIKQRRGTAAAWTAANPTLDSAEFGVETDTGKIKLGDGSTAWTALNYLLEDAALEGTPTAPTAAPGTNTTQVANTAFVKGAVDNATYAPRTALYLPGVSGNYTTTPDAASLDITGDIDLRAEVAPDVWFGADYQTLLSKGTDYALQTAINGRLFLFINGSIYQSTVSPTVIDGVPKWVRATRSAATGIIKFYISDDGATWSQVGADVSSPAGAINVNAVPLGIGQRTAGAAQVLSGKVYRAQVYDGIDGTLVADYRADAPMAPRYRDSTGKVWTINGSAWTWMVA